MSDGNSEVYVKTINSALLEHPQIGGTELHSRRKLIFCLFVLRFFSEAPLKLRNSCVDEMPELGPHRVCLIKATYTHTDLRESHQPNTG